VFGLRVCPDADTLVYSLCGEVHPGQGWGVAGDTFRALARVRQLGGAAWFNLGDVDLGLHLYRTELLRQGVGLADITGRVARALGVTCGVLPMCEQPVTTRLETDEGPLDLQDYLVRRRAEPRVRRVTYAGISEAVPAPGVLDALGRGGLLVIAPSNPFISIGPILAVPGVRAALRSSPALRVGVTPLVGGRALKGPTDKMMAELGLPVSPVTVAQQYRDCLDAFVLDSQDAALRPDIEALGLRCVVAPTVMDDLPAKQALARKLLNLADRSRAAP
jgi:LPPG:FO 2-phospho-L-lactate transferase